MNLTDILNSNFVRIGALFVSIVVFIFMTNKDSIINLIKSSNNEKKIQPIKLSEEQLKEISEVDVLKSRLKELLEQKNDDEKKIMDKNGINESQTSDEEDVTPIKKPVNKKTSSKRREKEVDSQKEPTENKEPIDL